MRKKVKVSIEVTLQELRWFEQHNICTPLCKNHKILDDRLTTEVERAALRHTCEACARTEKQWTGAALKIERKLWKAFGKKVGWK